MHKLFAEWYRIAGIDPKSDDLPKRWAGVEAVVSTTEADKTVDLARLFLGSTTLNTQVKEQFAAVFQKADPAFPMRDNGLELRVLAGTVVAQYVETQRTDVGNALALAVVSGACLNIRRQAVLLPDIVSIAANYLFHEAVKVRAYSHVPEVKGMAKTDQLLTDVKAAAAQNNLAATVEALGGPLQKLHAGIGAVAKSSNEAVNHLGLLVASALEQTDVLWWLFASRSRDTSELYSEIALPAASLVAGKELADLTKVLPGPIAAPAVLDKILAGAKDASHGVSLEAAVTGVDAAWKQRCLETADPRLDELCPIHLAFRRSADGAAWIRAFESASGIKVKSSVTAVALATQMYNERLLQRSLHA